MTLLLYGFVTKGLCEEGTLSHVIAKARDESSLVQGLRSEGKVLSLVQRQRPTRVSRETS